MKLYYTPGACSLSPHIVLREAGYEFDIEKVDLKTKTTESGSDYNTISEKSYVPLLVLDNGEKLSEGSAIVQYLADQKPETELAPKAGTFERVRLNELLSFISAEVHKSFFPFFAGLNEETIQVYRKKLEKSFQFASEKLQGKKYLMGDRFTVADAYLFTVLSWTKPFNIDLSPWPTLGEYMARIAARPKVAETLKAEGLSTKDAAA